LGVGCQGRIGEVLEGSLAGVETPLGGRGARVGRRDKSPGGTARGTTELDNRTHNGGG